MFSIIASRVLHVALISLVQDAPPGGSIPQEFPPQPDIVLADRSHSPMTQAETGPVDERVRTLTARASASSDIRVRVDSQLAAANLALAEQLEPSATRSLLGLDIGEHREAALDAAATAKRWIDEAVEALDGLEPSEDDDEEWLSSKREDVHRLRAFGDALTACLAPDGDESTYRKLRMAASGLSVMLEDSNEQIAGAASLWQAALYVNAGLADRALALLDPALATPPTKQVRSAFFARLLRCRAIAAQKRHTAALALLFQLEERCEDWFPVQADRGDALRAVTIVEWQVLRDWHGTLTGESQETQRRWCAKKAKALLDERFTHETPAILRLGRTFPTIAAPPDDAAGGEPLVSPQEANDDQPAPDGD